jgi:uncharacterized membrane protein
MSTKSSNRPASRQQKKAQFSKPAAKSHKKNIAIIGALATIGLFSYFSGRGLTDQPQTAAVTVSASTSGAGAASDGAPVSEDISIPISTVSSGKAMFFNYIASDKTPVRFFVIKSSDGVYRAALDSCDVCYRHKKGYQQAGDDMVCRKCGQHFPSNLVNDVTGGCNPVALTRTVAGGNLLIKAADLESMKTYF